MLKFIGLSGTTGVTENLYLYEYTHGNDKKGEIIMVDCGVGFPGSSMYGIDLVLPDFSYVVKNRNRLKAILITHGHEDHIGALPYLLKKVNVPIYSTPLVAGFIKDKFEDHGITKYDLRIINPEKDVLTLGSFKVTPFRISHSIPDGVAFVIDTPEGKVFHVADYKFDWTPVTGKPFDITKAAQLAADGVQVLISDSLGSMTPGYTRSEKRIESQIESIVRSSRGRVFFTTISSNISRIQQALNVAKKVGRKVAFIGFSIDKKAHITEELGYLDFGKGIVKNPRALHKMNKEKTMYIIAGGYGQEGSALYRVADDDHRMVRVDKGDRVIFSSDPAPPGTKELVDALVDKLINKGVAVNYYDTQEDLHVSGHGSQEDIKLLFALTKPKYFIPVGGTIRHNRGYTQIAEDMGFDPRSVFELSPGETVEFYKDKAHRGRSVHIKTVLVDGLGIGDVGNVVLNDRKQLSTDGIVTIVVHYSIKSKKIIRDPELSSRGFVFEKHSKNFLANAGKAVKVKLDSKKELSKSRVKEITLEYLERYFYDETGRKPVILPLIVEVI